MSVNVAIEDEKRPTTPLAQLGIEIGRSKLDVSSRYESDALLATCPYVTVATRQQNEADSGNDLSERPVE